MNCNMAGQQDICRISRNTRAQNVIRTRLMPVLQRDNDQDLYMQSLCFPPKSKQTFLKCNQSFHKFNYNDIQQTSGQ